MSSQEDIRGRWSQILGDLCGGVGMGYAGLLAAGLVLAACGESDPSDPDSAGPLAALIVVDGASQTGVVGAELSEPVAVRAVDEAGRPIAGQLVMFTVVSGGGSAFGGTVQTNAEGEARERWTLGTSTSVGQTLRARSVDPGTGAAAEAEFTATATPDAPAQLAKTGGDGQRGQAGEALPTPVASRVTDGFGNPVPGVMVSFSVTAGGGSLSTETSTTDESGVASTRWTLGDAGVQQATAAIDGLPAVTFTASLGPPGLRWDNLASMPVAVRAPAAATDGSRVYVFGGWTTEPTDHTQIYDLGTDTWSSGAPVPVDLNFGMAVATPAGIHLIGGGDASTKFTSHYLYSPSTDSWAVRASLPEKLDAGAVFVREGQVYVFGGNHGGADVSDMALRYDPEADTWSLLRNLPTARLSPAGALYQGRMVVSGGWAEDGLQVVEAYDAGSDTWSALPALPERVETHASGVVAGLLCIVGGRRERGATVYDATRCLDAVNQTWSEGPPMPVARDEMGYVEVSGALYIFGGGTSDVSAAAYRLRPDGE